jgi:leucyl-tRNA synthetase
MAPHISDELWEQTGHGESIHKQEWPSWDAELAADDVVTLVVQVNGRVRDKIEVSASITEDEARGIALSSPRLSTYLDGKEVHKVIYVPGKLVNLVVG